MSHGVRPETTHQVVKQRGSIARRERRLTGVAERTPLPALRERLRDRQAQRRHCQRAADGPRAGAWQHAYALYLLIDLDADHARLTAAARLCRQGAAKRPRHWLPAICPGQLTYASRRRGWWKTPGLSWTTRRVGACWPVASTRPDDLPRERAPAGRRGERRTTSVPSGRSTGSREAPAKAIRPTINSAAGHGGPGRLPPPCASPGRACAVGRHHRGVVPARPGPGHARSPS